MEWTRIFLLLLPFGGLAQGIESFWGRIGPTDFSADRFQDTVSSAIIMNEVGEAHFDKNYDLFVDYYVKIKITKKEGVRFANFAIPLHMQDGRAESLERVEGVTYNLGVGNIQSEKIEPRNIYTEDLNPYRTAKKFTLKNVQVGSIIEVKYQIKTPFIFRLWPWQFQGEIPKMRSEFQAIIPANYVYNIVLKGNLKLTRSDARRIPDCVVFGAGNADCAHFTYIMENIPAFVEEEYMTAKANFVSALEFELSEVRHFDGQVVKYTETWQDVDSKLLKDPDFGLQPRKAKKEVEALLAKAGLNPGNSDQVGTATNIYETVKRHFAWNQSYGKYAEHGLKKAIETRSGNVADINLTLLAALQQSGFEAEPVILATRETGLPRDVHPVLSDFNYVIVQVIIEGKEYLLDATEPNFPFGILPLRCLNGKGRLIGKESKWVSLKSAGKDKSVVTFEGRVDSSGKMIARIEFKHYEYKGAIQRAKLAQAGSHDEYVRALSSDWPNFRIISFTAENENNFYEPLVERLEVEVVADDGRPEIVYVSPFQIGSFAVNPFRATERQYPVDFGVPLERSYTFLLSLPDNYEVDELPESNAFSLPANGGKYLLNASRIRNQINITNLYLLSKSVYSALEYKPLKEFFNRAVQSHQSMIVLKKQ